MEGWVQHWIYCLFSCPHYIHFGLILIYYEWWCRKEARSYYSWSSIIVTNELFLFIVVIQDRDQWVISSLLNFTNPYFGIYILTWHQKHRKSILECFCGCPIIRTPGKWARRLDNWSDISWCMRSGNQTWCSRSHLYWAVQQLLYNKTQHYRLMKQSHRTTSEPRGDRSGEQRLSHQRITCSGRTLW